MTRSILLTLTFAIGGCSTAQSQEAPSALPTAETYTIASAALSEDRELLVSLPASYQEGGSASYPVLYVLDGSSNLLHSVASARHLASGGRIPEMIVVGIPNVRREFDMTPSDMPLPMLGGQGGRAHAFLEFLRDEVGDWVQKRFRAGSLRVLLGHSHGGLFAGYAFTVDPSAFASYILMDAPMGLVGGALTDRVIQASSSAGPTRIVSARRAMGFQGTAWDELEASAAPGVRLTRLDMSERGESHSSMVMPATYEGLAAVFEDFPERGIEPQQLDQVTRAFAAVGDAMGHELDPSLAHLVDNADAFLMMGQGATASELIDEAEALYGTSPRLDRLRDRVAEVGDGGGLDQVALDEGAPARRADLERYFGTWEGRMHHEGGVPEYFLVTFFADGDQVVATFAGSRPGRKEYREPTPLDFVRLRDGLIEFGTKNNRMPGGTWVYSVLPSDDRRMEGEKHLEGVMLPVGAVLPKMNVTLDRREPEGSE